MATAYTQANRAGRLVTDLGEDALLLLSAAITETLSAPYAITIDAMSATAQPLHDLLGTYVSVELTGEAHRARRFGGVLWSYEELGNSDEGHRMRLSLSPPTQFMTLNRRNRIFQNKSVLDIVKAIVTAPHTTKLSASYEPVEYVVQYGESDWQFLCRLLEYEGIYFHWTHAEGASTLVLLDDRNAHEAMAPATLPARPAPHDSEPQAWGVVERRGLAPVKVTLDDYDFEAPTSQMAKFKTAAKPVGAPSAVSGGGGAGSGGDWSGGSEIYEFPAKHTSKSTALAERRSANWLDSHRREMARSQAATNVVAAAVGRTVTLTFDNGNDAEYLIVGTRHAYSGPDYRSGGGREDVSVELELMPAADQYRPALDTPRPRIFGPQTALVVGPSGEEIHTDKYGRVKVQFPWDREGKGDENSSCFIRVVQSGAGQGWGSFALPRIGQEVVVEFLDGDPDRPLVTGAVYNGRNAVPETLPAAKTQFGMKSRITKGGGGFNRLWFEDKKDEEVVWFRAERDYKANIVNADETRDYDKGNRVTTFKEGNDTLTLTKGDVTTTLDEGDETRTLTAGARTTTIQKNETLDVKEGNRAVTITQGNDELTVTKGDVTVKVTGGNHKTDAGQSIELVCGASSIKLDPKAVTIKSLTINIEGELLVQTKGLAIKSEASGVSVLKGSMVMIN